MNITVTLELNVGCSLGSLLELLDHLDESQVVDNYVIDLDSKRTPFIPEGTFPDLPQEQDRSLSAARLRASQAETVVAAMESARNYLPYASDEAKAIFEAPYPGTERQRAPRPLASFICKSCGADKGEPCVTTRGKNVGRAYRGYHHDARYDARTEWLHNLGGK